MFLLIQMKKPGRCLVCATHWDIRSGKIMLYNLISKTWYSGLNKFELDEIMFSYKQFFITIFIICPIFISCNSLKCDKENSEEIFDKEFDFSLDYKNQEGVPVVNILINDKKYNFIIDTGSSVNRFYRHGIEKTYGSMAEFDNVMTPVFMDVNKVTGIGTKKEMKKKLYTCYNKINFTTKEKVNV